MFLFEFKNVSISNAGIERLEALDWRVRRGEHWAVLGANGSGKTSVAEALSGRAHFSGEIEYGFGATLPDPCERIATVSFQLHKQFAAQADGYFQSRWYPGEEEATLTAGEIIGLQAARNAAQRQRILSAVKSMGIEGLMARQALHLSTGEMRRLLVARALLHAPALLVLDEPFIGLDAACRKSLSEALTRVMARERGPAIVLLTARSWELPKGITHGLYLRNGRLLGSAKIHSRMALDLDRRSFRPARHAPVIFPAQKNYKHATRKPIVRLRGVTIQAGGATILQRVNWTVHAGECWAVLGPNGAGKTTLLSLLTGDHPQSFAQSVELFGKLRGDHATRDLKARIGHASPDIALHYDGQTSAFDFVCTGFFETLGLYSRATKAQERTAWRWLDFFGLRALAQRPFRLLSDGQQRLVLLARAVVKNPALLILDEPCQGLDRAARERVRLALNRCAARGTTLVVVSHYLDELPRGVTHRLELRKSERVKG